MEEKRGPNALESTDPVRSFPSGFRASGQPQDRLNRLENQSGGDDDLEAGAGLGGVRLHERVSDPPASAAKQAGDEAW